MPPAPLFRDPVFDGAADPSLIWNDQERAWWVFYHEPAGQRARRPGRRPLVPRYRHRHRLVGRRRPDLELSRHRQGPRVRGRAQHLLGALPRRARPDLSPLRRLHPGRSRRLERRPAHRPLHQPGPRELEIRSDRPAELGKRHRRLCLRQALRRLADVVQGRAPWLSHLRRRQRGPVPMESRRARDHERGPGRPGRFLVAGLLLDARRPLEGDGRPALERP